MDHLVGQLGWVGWRMPHFRPFASEEIWGPLVMFTATDVGSEPSRLAYDQYALMVERSGLVGRFGGRYRAEGGRSSLSTTSPWRAADVVVFCTRRAMGVH